MREAGVARRRLALAAGRGDALDLERVQRRPDLAVHDAEADQRSGLRALADDHARQRLDDGLLDRAQQRPRAVARMEADLREMVDDAVVDLDEQPAPRDPLAHQQAAEMPPRDRADRLAVERVERDQPVDAVEELRAEEPLGLVGEMRGAASSPPRRRRRRR